MSEIRLLEQGTLSLNDFSVYCYNEAKKRGFYETAENKMISSKLMLIVSELGEALEALRHDTRCKKLPARYSKRVFLKTVKDTFEDEIADTIIRIFDLCGYMGINLDGHVYQKLLYNASRMKLHGKVF
jgi:NTP pyrophosphatase (non-canonical NTP hydrolase)